ncbi:ADD [Mytilus coruscus]|uniref:ADD n=1 Tax=Mytilus coruscus TaxID=42192 RepID=A0A6J8BIC2_MYTCO|nr:ADD [Mytilus coruscus]
MELILEPTHLHIGESLVCVQRGQCKFGGDCSLSYERSNNFRGRYQGHVRPRSEEAIISWAPVNGPSSPSGKYIDNIDPDDPEYQRQMRRPADVKEDVKQMQDRSRVSLVLNSEAFRKELEEIINEQISEGNDPTNLIALQQITDLLNQNNKSGQTYGGFGRGITSVIPIADIKGMETTKYTKQEKQLRCKVASLYRVVDLNGWSYGIYNHISARINQEHEHFLINPFGVLYSEVTASSLVKVDMQGETIDPGSTTLGINKAGFTLHSAIHQARPDIKCIIHLHTPEVIAVSTMKCGFLPLSQESLIVGDVSFHDYNGILVDQEERDALQRSLGPTNKVMFLRNHGVVTCGSTVEEAYHYAVNVMSACLTQTKAVPAGVDNLILVSEEIKKRTFQVGSQGGGGVDTGGRKWKPGELEFEAVMRQLDNVGYRTGYLYRLPAFKQEVRKEKSNSDVEIPPTCSSFTYIIDGDVEHSKYVSPLKLARDRQKQNYKAGWLVNSPNNYIRQEVEETGTQNPKKYSKGYRTGYLYRLPAFKQEVRKEKSNSDVEIPPTCSSFTYIIDGDVEHSKYVSPLKLARDRQKQNYKAGWLVNSPNNYIRQEVEETGTQNPKKYSKWIPEEDGSPNRKSTPIKIENPNQFAPQGSNPKEFKLKQKEIRKDYYEEKISAGPQSKILEGITWEEAKKLQDGDLSMVGDNVIVYGAASKGIIQRDQQHNVQVYKTQYAANPFDSINEEEIEKYKIEVENRGKGEPAVEEDLSPGPDGKLISTMERMHIIQQQQVDDTPEPKPEVEKPKPEVPVETKRQSSNTSRSEETTIDDVFQSNYPPVSPVSPTENKEKPPAVRRSSSNREPPRSPALIQELKEKSFERSKSERYGRDHVLNGDEKPSSPAKSDTLKSTDSASGGDTLEERSSKEGSPVKELPSPTKDKKKKKKFRMPSFSKNKKNKESKESTL